MQRIKARESDIRQTVAYNKELENKLARISIDFHYSSVLAESYPKILEEKVFNKSFLDESRSTRVFSENEEPLLTYSKEENCCKKCEIF